MTLKAGAAVRDISPQTSLQLFGYPNVKRLCEGVHDPLLASAVYLDDGQKAVVQIALDILLLDPPTVRSYRRQIAGELGIDEEAVFISTTHTHSGPVTGLFLAWKGNAALPAPDEDYLRLIERQVLAAAIEAKANARPAEAAWTTANGEGVGGNRLKKGGVTDSEVGILAVRESGGGDLMALVVVYGMHPTVIHEDTPLVSSDFPHYARETVRSRYGEDVVIAYHQGVSGNQSPRNFVTGQTFEEAERLGTMLGERILGSLATLKPSSYSDDLELAYAVKDVDLPTREVPSVAEARKTLEEYEATYERLKAEKAGHGPVRTAECAIFGAASSVKLAEAAESGALKEAIEAHSPAQVQVLRIGDVCLAGLPGEMFVEYGLELKRRADVKVHVCTLVNGDLQGYIVTPEAAEAGGYEATNALFAPESGDRLIEAALELLEEV